MIKKQLGCILLKNFKLTKHNRFELLFIVAIPLIVSFFILFVFESYSNYTADQDGNKFTNFYIFIVIPTSFLISVTGYQRRWLFFLVKERMEGFRELQKIHGLKNVSYLFGNIIYSLILCSFPIILLFLCILGICLRMEIAIMWLFLPIFVLFALAGLMFVFVISRIFNNSEISSDFGTLIILISIGCSIISINHYDYYGYFVYALSWVPQTNFIASLLALSGDKQLNITLLIIYQAANIIFYFILYLYLERVLPNEYGKRQSPLFFLKTFRRNSYENFENDNEAELIDNDDSSSALIYEKQKVIPGQKKIISIVSISKNFDNLNVLSKISFPIYDNSVFALLGPNGSGKTTLINILCGGLLPCSGHIYINNVNIVKSLDTVIGKIGVCPQSNILYDNLTVVDNLLYMQGIKCKTEIDQNQEIEDILQLLELKAIENSMVHTLSGGAKRKVCLALALLGKPEIILLDEPSSGMDIQSRTNYWNLIKSLKKSNVAIILTTQHLEEAEALADYTAILSRGLILVQGTNKFIENKFGGSDKLTISLNSQAINHINLRELVVNNYPQAKILEYTEKIIRFEANIQHKNILKLIQLVEDQPSTLKLSIRRQSLEDAFVNLVEDPLTYLKEEGIIIENHLLERFKTVYEDTIIDFNDILANHTKFTWLSSVWGIGKKRLMITFLTTKNILFFIFPCIISNVLCYISVNIILNNYRGQGLAFFFIYSTLCINKIIMLSFLSTCVFYIYQVIKERDDGTRLLLRTMGTNGITYWLGHLVADVIIYTLQMLIIFLTCIIPLFLKIDTTIKMLPIGLDSTHSNDFFHLFVSNSVLLATNLLIFGFLFINLSYVSSRFFPNPTAALVMFNFFMIIIFIMALNLIVLIVSELVFSDFRQLAIFIVNPIMVCFMKNSQELDDQSEYFLVDAYIIFYGFIYFFATVLIESIAFNRKSPNNNMTLDESIQEGEILKVNHLTKQYDLASVNAINNLSFKVMPKQVFALLGPNGAGKSTTFNIISGGIKSTSGSVTFNSEKINLKRDFAGRRPILGKCCQENIFWNELTVYKNLSVFADLKGYWGQSKKNYLKSLIKLFKLNKEKNKIAKNLSGGSKRKLCIAISFLNNPSLVILDEPTTGVDPEACKCLRKLISSMKEQLGTSVLLTSHSLKEVDQIADCVGIMVNGTLQINGSLEKLKQTFDIGFNIEIIPNINYSQDQLIQYVFQQFKAPSLALSTDKTSLTFRVEGMKCSQIIYQLQNMLQLDMVDNFSICNSSLEQFYLFHSRNEGTQNSNLLYNTLPAFSDNQYQQNIDPNPFLYNLQPNNLSSDVEANHQNATLSTSIHSFNNISPLSSLQVNNDNVLDKKEHLPESINKVSLDIELFGSKDQYSCTLPLQHITEIIFQIHQFNSVFGEVCLFIFYFYFFYDLNMGLLKFKLSIQTYLSFRQNLILSQITIKLEFFNNKIIHSFVELTQVKHINIEIIKKQSEYLYGRTIIFFHFANPSPELIFILLQDYFGYQPSIYIKFLFFQTLYSSAKKITQHFKVELPCN